MKILYSCLSKSWGGMEMYTLTAVKQLLKRNIRVELLCVKESRIHIEANNLGLIIHPVKMSGYFNPFSTLRLYSILRRGGYNLIHTQFSKDLWLIVPALTILKKRIPVVLTKQLGSFIKKKDILHKWIYSNVTLALAISRVIKKNLLETVPLTEDKIIILHNGIDIKRFNPENVDNKKIRKEFGISENEILIGMLARFSPGKGHEQFLEAAKKLSSKYNNLKFLIVGEASRGESVYEETIKKLAESHGLKNIIFSGFRSDIPEVLAAMDIFVFPSHAEAFGIALAEALAMGIPSVASNSDGILDITVDGVTGYLFENKNAADLEIKIELLIKSQETRDKFGIAARQRAVEKFDLEGITDRTVDIYNELIK
ncbi:MAG: glycosyltransferase family 4 protein [Ignavibacteriaceae bacterium]